MEQIAIALVKCAVALIFVTPHLALGAENESNHDGQKTMLVGTPVKIKTIGPYEKDGRVWFLYQYDVTLKDVEVVFGERSSSFKRNFTITLLAKDRSFSCRKKAKLTCF